MTDFNTYFDELLEFGLEHEPMHPVALGLKAAEEFGEVSEQLLYGSGYLQHKQLDEPIENELGDLLNCIVVAVAKSLKESGSSNEEIKHLIVKGMFTKLDKYKKLVNEVS